MKLSLVVLTPGKTQGKAISVSLSHFLIGRDPHCHLRPASPLISNRHCALLTRAGKVFLRDFESTNGSFVNNERIKGEIELKHGDHVRLGPLAFRVQIEDLSDVNRPTPLPGKIAPAVPPDDEAAAALLLSLQDDVPPPGSKGVDSEGVPTGSTVMEMPLPPAPEDAKAQDPNAKSGDEQSTKTDEDHKKKEAAAKGKTGDTAIVASELLQKYLRRPRTKPS